MIPGATGTSDQLTLHPQGLLPVLPLCLELGGVKLSLFSVISTFGAPQDVNTNELRIETFYPTDEATRVLFADVTRSSA